ncbi:MAG: MATE family efflux transporter, partial [Winogradskyella sp.]|nr:MATE family efflux transporter [Winogradskyella sp.]
ICAPLFLISLFQAISTNFVVIFLGFIDETYSAGLYTIALSIIVIPNIMLFSFNTAISPKLSQLIKKRKNLEIQENLNAICGIQTFIGILIFLIVLIFGREILSAWGEDFKDAYDLIIILFIGVIFNLAMGGTGILLTLSGRYNLVSKITFFSTILNVLLPYFVYLKFGLIGLGYLFVVLAVLVNVVRLILVKKYFGFYIYPGFSKKVMKSLIER